MQESHAVEWRFRVREVSLQQLAALWSEIERALPEVECWSGQLYLDGEFLRHCSAFDEPGALAQSPLALRRHLVQNLSLHIASNALCVRVSYGCEESFKLLPALPDALRVRISGASDRAVLAVSDVVEEWGGRSLRTRRRALWLNFGAFAAGAAATGWGTALLSGHTFVAVMMTVEWVFVFWVACFFLRRIPAVDRWMVQLCVVDTPGSSAGRRNILLSRSPVQAPAPE